MRIKCFLLFVSLAVILQNNLAQTNKKIVGNWQGKLNVGIELSIIFHIKQDSAGTFHTTLDSPDQSVFGLGTDKTIVKGDSLFIVMSNIKAAFSGRLENDSLLAETFTQSGSFSLQLKKTEKIEKTELKRPQTPKPPFSYKSEDVEYESKNKLLRYGATITIPNGKGPFPAAILITGSGPQNRDEEIMGHKLFAVLSDYLTTRGFIILRVDDRGVGKSTGNFHEATSLDFANDVHAGIDYLKLRPEADIKKIGLIGHSEGGMIAPIVASQRNDIDFMVLLAAPGIKILELMAEQNAAIIKSTGISDSATNTYRLLFAKVNAAIISSADTATAKINAEKILQGWLSSTSKDIIKELDLEGDDIQTIYISTMIKSLFTPWFKYFMAFDPQPYLQKLNTKVLALNGSRDIQVISKSNLAGIEAALKKSKSPKFEVKEMAGLNHLFQTCRQCTLNEYGQLEETFSPLALQLIGDWLQKNVK